VLGDVFFAGAAKSQAILDRLKGRKILIRGNHDQHSLTKLKSMFSEVYTSHELVIAGARVLLSHYPFAPTKLEQLKHRLKNFWKFWRRKKYMDLRYMDRRPINNGGWLLHGHVHNSWKIRGKMINVGVDVWDFTPVSLTTIERIIKDSDKI
jgi:calcineurin-like phosphoesterase family protein